MESDTDASVLDDQQIEIETGTGRASKRARAEFVTLVVPFVMVKNPVQWETMYNHREDQARYNTNETMTALAYMDTGYLSSTSAKGAAARALTKAMRMAAKGEHSSSVKSHLESGKLALVYVQRQSVSNKRELQVVPFVGSIEDIRGRMAEKMEASVGAKRSKLSNIVQRNIRYKANVNSLNIDRAEATYRKNSLQQNYAPAMATKRVARNKKIFVSQHFARGHQARVATFFNQDDDAE